MRELSVLSNIRIASPCTTSWAAMQGDERVRFCGDCKLNVYNISALTRAAAEELVQTHEGRLCVRFFQRQDGTVITRDCPVGLRRLRWAAARVVGGIAAAVALLAGSLAAFASGQKSSADLRLRFLQPFARVTNWLSPPVYVGLGEMAAPNPQKNRAVAYQDPEYAAKTQDAWAQVQDELEEDE